MSLAAADRAAAGPDAEERRNLQKAPCEQPSLHKDQSRQAGLTAPLPGRSQSSKANPLESKPPAAKLTAGVLADVFGEDSSSSDSDHSEHDAEAVQEASAQQAPLQAPEPSAPVLTNGKVVAELRYSTRGKRSQSAAMPDQPRPATRAKRKAEATENPAGAARAKPHKKESMPAARPSRCKKAAEPKKEASGKAVAITGVTEEKSMTGVEVLGQSAPQAVDWKAYADDLDQKLAEAEALLSDDSASM